ncbi:MULTISPECIES: ATP-binding cassette domain-containing protein [Vibrio harveyi group]|uniref:ATP-binding cassette domain-containing protein n=1 Tax=Vibrio harveyi group TaxID=717610 RepID=UPI00226A52B6|nr:ATP-binding cassette domain-containing protein [Vibrio parahaemolyticus]MCX8755917.1 ATP-binding cassette domain-containing protein [Vibrio parahaemolyticus]HCG8192240.1 ATP-binding cassette domain-containing protein [Vibrio parahaemolyticus]
MKINVSKIKKDNIFTDAYLDLTENNELDFERKRVCVLYGPNGTGKTSLSKVLSQEKGAEYSINIDGTVHTESSQPIAHIISDQNDRNVIQGETQDFILGDNIKKEYELKEKLNNSFSLIFEKELVDILKKKYQIAKIETNFNDLILDKELLNYIKDIANSRSRGKKINRENFIDKVYGFKIEDKPDYDEGKLKFFIDDFAKNDSIIRALSNYNFEFNTEEKGIVKLEEHSEAVVILNKFNYIDECLVCDHPIDVGAKLAQKNEQYENISKNMDEKEKEIAEKIIKDLQQPDSFNIKSRVRTAITKSDKSFIEDLILEFERYKSIYWQLLAHDFISASTNYDLKEDYESYQTMLKNKPEFGSEDILFIEQFLNESLEREISLERDSDNNIKLMLGGKDFLNKNRQDLELSNGEQNFLSLSFELLKAKNSTCELIVLDDPISSFDSIYKNKLAYAILSFLFSKKTLILTHNTDLIKLLEHQAKQCLNLYYFNNIDGESNGFTPINQREMSILLYIHEFLNLLREGIKGEIADEKQFLVSLVPFMRGFCQIRGLVEEKNKLTQLMHGYCDESIDVTDIYEKLFSDRVVSATYKVSARDIVDWEHSQFNPLKSDAYPLLSKTLRHTLTYLYLRLNVEKVLVDKFDINTKKHDMLSSIIFESFKGNEREKIQNRVFFMSKKTLLNEFNHFEMDMNIFQPAIDITDRALHKEREQILNRLKEL